jgi:hypothetical protein
MPGNDSIRLNHDKRLFLFRPNLVEQDPEQPIMSSQQGTRMFSLKYNELMAKSDDFKTEIAS